jgi:hypothetical protein
VDRYLRGQSIREVPAQPRTISFEDVDVGLFNRRDRQIMPTLPADKRGSVFDEVACGFTELAALKEADRCFQCGLFPNKKR